MSSQYKPSSFTWAKASKELYTMHEGTVLYNAGGKDLFRPVVGSLGMSPNTGKYFYEFRVNCDNTRVGICTADIDLKGEMGKIDQCLSLNLQTGAVEVLGHEVKRLWRLVTPVSGGRCGFTYDSDACTLRFYLNSEFQGTLLCGGTMDVNQDSPLPGSPIQTALGSLKGKTLFPCVGIAGVEIHNRDIGIGKKSAVVNMSSELAPYKNIV